jgi:hypothetical protein
MSSVNKREIENEEQFERNIQWMLDTPQFIDQYHLEAFYDAVLQPQISQKESFKIEITNDSAKEISKKFGGGLEIGPRGIAQMLMPVAGGSFEVGGGIAVRDESREQQTQTIEFESVHTPQRQLIQLMIAYLGKHPSRIYFVSDVTIHKEWFKTTEDTPKSIVFLDLPSKEESVEYGLPKTMLFPMAVEFSSGKVIKLHDKLGLPGDEEKWNSFIDSSDPKKATNEIKKATEQENDRISAISYRIPLHNTTARLCFEPNGEYNNGTFIYNLIRMGWKYGLRIIGTVNRGPDVRVLAVYRK